MDRRRRARVGFALHVAGPVSTNQIRQVAGVEAVADDRARIVLRAVHARLVTSILADAIDEASETGGAVQLSSDTALRRATDHADLTTRLTAAAAAWRANATGRN